MAQTEPILGDGDGDDESEVEAEFVPSEHDVCTWTDDIDEKRRAFIIHQMANPEYSGDVQVKNMNAIYLWLKNGAIQTESPRAGKLKIAKAESGE